MTVQCEDVGLLSIKYEPEPRWLRAGAHVIALDTVGYVRMVGPSVIDGPPLASIRSSSCAIALMEPVHECELFVDFGAALEAAERFRAGRECAQESGGGA